MEETLQKYPRDKFKTLPDPVKDWLASTQITYLVSDLNRRLGFSEAEKMTVIPTLILRLAISAVDPENFISELGKLLDLSPSASKALAQEIEEKMLRPIEVALRNEVGIDIKLIHLPRENKTVINESLTSPARQVSPTATAMNDEKLIPSPEIAHPDEYKRPVPTQPIQTQPATAPSRPMQSPVYSPSSPKPAPAQNTQTPTSVPTTPPSQSLPKVEPLPARPAANSAPVMPKIEPLPRFNNPLGSSQTTAQPPAPPRPSTPPISRPPSTDQKTPIPVKVMPSRVPDFLKDTDLK